MDSCPRHGHAPALALKQSNHFSRKAGEGGEPTQKTRDDGQTPDRIKLGRCIQPGNGQANAVAADGIGGQGAPGQMPVSGQPQAQLPARQGAKAGSCANGDDVVHGFLDESWRCPLCGSAMAAYLLGVSDSALDASSACG